MATSAKGSKQPVKSGGKRPNPDPYRVPMDVVPMVEPVEESVMGVMGWIAAVLLVALMLPMLAFLYLDVLEAKAEVNAQVEKVERLRREIEKSERKNRDTPKEFTDNPLFDRRSKREHL